MRVLVLGDGLLGKELVKQSNWDYLSRKKDKLDVTIKSISYWSNFFANYDVIINCIANTGTYSNDRESHWQTNYGFVDTLIDVCNHTNKKLVHISTDYVYVNCKRETPSENDVPVHGENWYCYTKMLSDGLVQLRANNHLIVRCSHKPKPFPYKRIYVDKMGNFDYVENIVPLIIDLINIDAKGVYNVGTGKKSMFDLIKNDLNDFEILYTPDEYPKDTSMNLTKLNNALK